VTDQIEVVIIRTVCLKTDTEVPATQFLNSELFERIFLTQQYALWLWLTESPYAMQVSLKERSLFSFSFGNKAI
jgi:hypothetical protein